MWAEFNRFRKCLLFLAISIPAGDFCILFIKEKYEFWHYRNEKWGQAFSFPCYAHFERMWEICFFLTMPKCHPFRLYPWKLGIMALSMNFSAQRSTDQRSNPIPENLIDWSDRQISLLVLCPISQPDTVIMFILKLN